MKTAIGGDRLGSGNKENISMRNFERSSHDLSTVIRTSMSAGTLVPFLSELALPGDNWDIDLACEVLTLPTVGPLFGSYKVQLDVFAIPIRLYNAQMHGNKLNIGMDMSKVKLPQLNLRHRRLDNETDPAQYEDNAQMNPSCILKYFGISGLGRNVDDINQDFERKFNAVPLLAYWDIYKNYYANKQEERGFAIHIDNESEEAVQEIFNAIMYEDGSQAGEVIFESVKALTINPANLPKLEIHYLSQAEEPDPTLIKYWVDGVEVSIMDHWETPVWDDVLKILTFTNYVWIQNELDFEVKEQSSTPINPIEDYQLILEEFPLSNIDLMRKKILQHDDEEDGAFVIEGNTGVHDGVVLKPYSMPLMKWGSGDSTQYSRLYSQEGLGIKTYQSDVLNNWINTEFIDGDNGVNAVSAVTIDVSSDSFTIDALNIQMKIYKMLNRIAISGGSYDDWLEAQWTHERKRGIEEPMYMGGLIKELTFEEVISQAATEGEPLGQLAGRGRLTNKNKGGHIKVRVDEPSYIMGIVSLTPRIDYSQGNKWDMDLQNMNELHVPSLDAIGFEDLITERMAWQCSEVYDGEWTKFSAGKQPAWINYMTNINRTYGNFADRNKEMFMTLNRRYDIQPNGIGDITTYIDPKKFNHIFAETNLDAQNFWVQIKADITARRKMSAKLIPNL